jgi:tetratricopeptide (TPR) repeat protein
VLTRFRRAWFNLQKGEVDRALEDYDQLIEHDPTNTRAYICRAAALARKGEIDAALPRSPSSIRRMSRPIWGAPGTIWPKATPTAQSQITTRP